MPREPRQHRRTIDMERPTDLTRHHDQRTVGVNGGSHAHQGAAQLVNPPEIRPWNLALRLSLEVGAFVGLGAAAWDQTDGAVRLVAVVAIPLIAATVWGTFNVPDDPSRSGRAPVVVSGWVRLVVELAILGVGWIGYLIAGRIAIGVVFALLTVVHYAFAGARSRWLLLQ